PPSKQLFQAISRQAGLAACSASISAFKTSGVAGFCSATGDGWAQARPANSTQHTSPVRLRMVFHPFPMERHACRALALTNRPGEFVLTCRAEESRYSAFLLRPRFSAILAFTSFR